MVLTTKVLAQMLVFFAALQSNGESVTYMLHPRVMDEISDENKVAISPHKGAWVVTVTNLEREKDGTIHIN